MIHFIAASVLVAALPTPELSVEGDRAFLGGTETGALVAPASIENIDQVRTLCEVLGPKVDAASRDPRRGLAHRAVYRVRVPAQGFRLKSDAMALDLQSKLRTLREHLSLAVLTGTDATFALTRSEANGVRTAIQSQALALDVVFRLEGDAKDQPACFAGGFAGTYGLRIEPLSFTLLDPKQGTVWAHLRTARGSAFAKWLHPGAAEVSVKVRSAGHTLDEVGLGGALATDGLRECLLPVTAQRSASGLISMTAVLSQQGRLEELKVQIDALQEAGVVQCAVRVLRETQLAAQPRRTPVSVQVRVRRGDG